jgi:hypothetical protein
LTKILFCCNIGKKEWGGMMPKKYNAEVQQIIEHALKDARLLKRSERKRLLRKLMCMSEISAILLINELKPVLRKLSAVIKTIRDSV